MRFAVTRYTIRMRALADAVLHAVKPWPLRRRLVFSIGIFLAAFCVRSLYAVDVAPDMYTPQQPGVRMAGRYHRAALAMAGGGGILFPAEPDPTDTGLLARPPGYAFYLSRIYLALGASFFSAQLVQNLLNSLSPVLLFLLAERLLGGRVASAAGLLAAVSPTLAFSSDILTPDSVSALPLLLALHAVTVRPLKDGPTGAACALAGAALGVSAWLRPNIVLLGPFLAFVLWLLSTRRRAAWKRLLLIVLGLTAVVAPVTVRNYAVYGELVPISINGGITLWEGIAEAGGERFGARMTDLEVAAEEAVRYNNPRYAQWWASPDGIERDRDRYRRSWTVIREHPWWYGRAMAARIRAMLDYTAPTPPPVAAAEPPSLWTRVVAVAGPAQQGPRRALEPRISDRTCLAMGTAMGWARPLVRVAQILSAALMLPFILVGTILAASWDWRKAALLWAVPIYYIGLHSVFIFEWRVLVPMHYSLFVLAGACWAGLVSAAAGAFTSSRRAS